MDDTYLDNPILYQLSQPVPRPPPSAETLRRVQSLKERYTQLCGLEDIGTLSKIVFTSDQ